MQPTNLFALKDICDSTMHRLIHCAFTICTKGKPDTVVATNLLLVCQSISSLCIQICTCMHGYCEGYNTVRKNDPSWLPQFHTYPHHWTDH